MHTTLCSFISFLVHVEEDFFIGDSNPIATYFANTYAKKSGIYGKDIEQKARVDELLAWEATFRVNMSKFFVSKIWLCRYSLLNMI